MSNIASLLKRVERIEAKQLTGRITSLLNLAGCSDEIAAEAVTNWRQWVRDDRATRIGDTLVIRAPVLTVEDWTARHVSKVGGLH